MAGQIDKNYASPGLRWGLLLEDHPGTEHAFALVPGSDVPNMRVPAEYGGDRKVCMCTITFPPETELKPVVAYKQVPSEGSPDEWNVLCTKTLGRALKKAGYPDNLLDLKALVHWRERNAEVTAITLGQGPTLALGTGERAAAATRALDAAVVESPEGNTGDDAVDDGEVPHPETIEALREAFNDLSGAQQKMAREKAKAAGSDLLNPSTEANGLKVLGWLRHLADQADGDDDSGMDDAPSDDEPVDADIVEDDAESIAELIAGLDAKETKVFSGFLRTIGAPADPAEMTDEQRSTVADWFASAEG